MAAASEPATVAPPATEHSVSLGTVLFFLIDELKAGQFPAVTRNIGRWPYAIFAICVLAFVALAEKSQIFAGRFSLLPFAPVPILLVASLTFVAVVLILANAPQNILINLPICALGEVSFSAYLLHFFVIHQLVHRLPAIFDASATGYRAIAICAGLWAVTVPLTFALSWVTFRFVEKPMIDLGRRILEFR